MAIIKVQSVFKDHSLHVRASHDPRFADGSAFCHGAHVPVAEASVPVVDAGFLHADLAYDVVTVSRGNFFRLDDHLDRMEQSCEKFFLKNPYDRDSMRGILHEMVRNSGLKDAYVWWAVTRGPLSPDRRDASAIKNALFAFAVPYFFQSNDEVRARGSNILISKRYKRIAAEAVDPTAKNSHWMDMKLGLYEAGAQGKDWVVLVDHDGYLTEAAGANIAFISNGELCTPADNCLMGVTRRSVFDLAGELGLRVNTGKFTVSRLVEADEAFTCSSAGGIMPIRSVDDRLIGGRDGPGPITENLHNLYWEKRWNGWHAEPVAYQEFQPG